MCKKFICASSMNNGKGTWVSREGFQVVIKVWQLWRKREEKGLIKSTQITLKVWYNFSRPIGSLSGKEWVNTYTPIVLLHWLGEVLVSMILEFMGSAMETMIFWFFWKRFAWHMTLCSTSVLHIYVSISTFMNHLLFGSYIP